MRNSIVVFSLLIAGASALRAEDEAPARRAFRAERRPDGSYSLRRGATDPRSPFSVGPEERPLGRGLEDVPESDEGDDPSFLDPEE